MKSTLVRTEDPLPSDDEELSWTVHASPRGSTQLDKHKKTFEVGYVTILRVLVTPDQGVTNFEFF